VTEEDYFGDNIIFRAGNPSPSNFRPRPVDRGFLSFRNRLSNTTVVLQMSTMEYSVGDALRTLYLEAETTLYSTFLAKIPHLQL